ncbi:helix-turn-helix domain-containing protein [Streptomyces buecherae]|uniref:helix-turn-helix domain-containing protein n=1 Tax=Streptomyces buecherae TaxID=2763006 RepID=UPI0036A5B001
MSARVLALVGREGKPFLATPDAAAELVGALLRHLRNVRGLTQGQVASLVPEVGSISTLHRCEKLAYGSDGKIIQALKPERVYALLRFYQVPDEVRNEVETLMQQSRGQQWWSRYADVVGETMNTLFALEAESKVIRSCQAIFIPGMLQTAGYTRAVMRNFYGQNPNPESRKKDLATVERRLELRMRRQSLLEHPDSAPEFEALIDEQAVRKELGGPQVMREQLRQLHSLGENRSKVHIRILPASATRFETPLHPAMTLFKPHDSGISRMIYLEEMNRGGTYITELEEVEKYQASMDYWWTKALSKQETLDFLLECVENLSTRPK